jgi:hypothetical protein
VSIEGVDYSWDRPNLGCLAASGKRFVVRYLTRDTTGKALTQGEAAAILAAGLRLVVLFEDSASRASQGIDAGRQDAQFAQQQLVACGGPANAPIYFAVDQDVQPSVVQPYFDGVVSELGSARTGVYGSYAVCAGVQSVGLRFQTYAWSGGRVLPGVDLYQHQNGVQLCGGTVDLCTALTDQPGFWGDTPASAGPTWQDGRSFPEEHMQSHLGQVIIRGGLGWAPLPQGVDPATVVSVVVLQQRPDAPGVGYRRVPVFSGLATGPTTPSGGPELVFENPPDMEEPDATYGFVLWTAGG